MKRQDQPHGSRCGRLLNGGIPCDLTKLPRCQAKSKTSGKQCRQPAMRGKRVCRFHGGKSPGAPKGNQYAFKSGLHTAAAIRERRLIRELFKSTMETLHELESQ